MQAKREHFAILSTYINLPFAIQIFVLSIFEWPFYTGFTVFLSLNVVFILANIADHDEMQLLLHFIWVFTVCQRSRIGVSSIQRVMS